MSFYRADREAMGFLANLYMNVPIISEAMCKLLGIWLRLEGKLIRARQLRTIDISREVRSLELYHAIIFLTREGLVQTELFIAPYMNDPSADPEARVFTYKIQASFYHILCLYHNNPPVRQLPRGRGDHNSIFSALHLAARLNVTALPYDIGVPGISEAGIAPAAAAADNHVPAPPGPTRYGGASPVRSDESFITNPYAALDGHGPSAHAPPGLAPPKTAQPSAKDVLMTAYIPLFEKNPKVVLHDQMPYGNPGIIRDYDPPVYAGTYLMPASDYTRMAREHFEYTMYLAESLLVPEHPLRLSAALEYAIFMTDCLGDEDGSLKMCNRAVLSVVYRGKPLGEEGRFLLGELTALALKMEKMLGMRQADEQYAQPTQPTQMAHVAQSGMPAHVVQSANSVQQARSIQRWTVQPIRAFQTAQAAPAQTAPPPMYPRQQMTLRPLYPPPTRELPTPPRQRADSASVKKHTSPAKANSTPGGVSLSPYSGQVQNVAAVFDSPLTKKTSLHTQTNNSTKGIPCNYRGPAVESAESDGSIKARKRRAMQRAEELLSIRRRAMGGAFSDVKGLADPFKS
jgi:hypothetical protein